MADKAEEMGSEEYETLQFKQMTLTPSQFEDYLYFYFSQKDKNGNYRASRLPALMIWGDPGIGKSFIVRAVVERIVREELGEDATPEKVREVMFDRLRDVRLSTLESSDVRGFPYVDRAANATRFAPPIFFPGVAKKLDPKEIYVLFLDEVNAASREVQAAAYQLVLDRAIGDFVLPDNVFIVAAGNPPTVTRAVSPMPAPLKNRFTHIYLKYDVDDWLYYAQRAGVHPTIISFITRNRDKLYDFDMDRDIAGATPRSWEFLSRVLWAVSDRIQEAAGYKFNPSDVIYEMARNTVPGKNYLWYDLMLNIASGIVGPSAGRSFMSQSYLPIKAPDLKTALTTFVKVEEGELKHLYRIDTEEDVILAIMLSEKKSYEAAKKEYEDYIKFISVRMGIKPGEEGETGKGWSFMDSRVSMNLHFAMKLTNDVGLIVTGKADPDDLFPGISDIVKGMMNRPVVLEGEKRSVPLLPSLAEIRTRMRRVAGSVAGMSEMQVLCIDVIVPLYLTYLADLRLYRYEMSYVEPATTVTKIFQRMYLDAKAGAGYIKASTFANEIIRHYNLIVENRKPEENYAEIMEFLIKNAPELVKVIEPKGFIRSQGE